MFIGFRKTRETGTGTKLLLPSLSLGFRHEERETQFFYADCSSIVSSQLTDLTNARAHPAVHKLTSLAQVRKINTLRLSPNLNSLLLFKITKNPSPSLPGLDLIHIPSYIPYLGFLLWHLRLSHPPRARVNTCTQCVHLTNALSRKVLSLTKPKDEIYETKNDNIRKSFRNYITTGGCSFAVLWGVVSKICSRLRAAFLCSSQVAYSPCVLLVSIWCIHLVVCIQLHLSPEVNVIARLEIKLACYNVVVH